MASAANLPTGCIDAELRYVSRETVGKSARTEAGKTPVRADVCAKRDLAETAKAPVVTRNSRLFMTPPFPYALSHVRTFALCQFPRHPHELLHVDQILRAERLQPLEQRRRHAQEGVVGLPVRSGVVLQIHAHARGD